MRLLFVFATPYFTQKDMPFKNYSLPVAVQGNEQFVLQGNAMHYHA